LLKKSLFSQQLCSAMENYEILRELGAGNFAKVYLALHTPTGRQVSREKNPTLRIDRSLDRSMPLSSPLCSYDFSFSLQVALKIIDKQGVPSARKLIHKVRREINNMRKLRHRNIVEIYESKSMSSFPAVTIAQCVDSHFALVIP